MIARVRAGFDKVLPAQAMECADKTGRHGMVHGPNRSPWRVRAAFTTVPDGSRVQCGDWRRQPRLPVRFRAGILRALLMRPQSAGFPNGSKTRVRRTGCGVEQFPCRRRARQHPISCAGWGSSPTQQWEEFPESPRAALAPVRRGDGGNSRPTGCGNGLRHPSENGYSFESRSETFGVAPRVLPSETENRGGAGRRAHRICGVGAPHRHTMTSNFGVT